MPYKDSRILIVDDQHQGRMVLVKILRALGCGYLEEAASGQEALERLEMNDPGFPYKVVFCDLFMPQMSGMELLIACRTRPELEGVSFIMVASESDQAAIPAAIEAGADDFVLTPFSNASIAMVDRKLRKLKARGGRNRPLVEPEGLGAPSKRPEQDRFMNEMRQRTGLSDANLGIAVRMLIRSFGQRIHPAAAVQFAGYLPTELESVILNAPGGPNATITEAAMLKGLVTLCAIPEDQARVALKGFCRGLRALLKPEGMEVLRKALPQDFHPFFME